MKEGEKMGKVITFGLQKGGVGKSTSVGITAYLLAEEKFKVLVVDMDSQGNVTEFLSDKPSNEFASNSILEVIKERDAKKYLHKISDQLDLLPANNYLALLPRYLYQNSADYDGTYVEQLYLAIEPILSEYDYILIDTPPALSEQTSNALFASDYVVSMFECSKFCYSAIPNFFESIISARAIQEKLQINKRVNLIGILRTLTDKRRIDAKIFNDQIEKDYPEGVFETIITRKASTGRIPFLGFDDNSELENGISQYRDFYKEFKQRIDSFEK